jgi:DNA-binding Lrp family transcriptional regulator
MKEVLKILEQDARTSHETIATMTGMKLEEVDRIIAKAEKDRVILKYRTVINWDKVGEQKVWALIEVKIIPERDVGFDAVAERIYRFPEARSVWLVAGNYDLAVLVTAKDIYEVSRFTSERLATIDAVHGTVTHFIMERYKEDDEILVDVEQSARQPLSP